MNNSTQNPVVEPTPTQPPIKTPTKPYMRPSYIISGVILLISLIATPILWGNYETATGELTIQEQRLDAKKIQLTTLQKEFDTYKKDQTKVQDILALAPGKEELDQENILRELEDIAIEHNTGLTSLTFREEATSPHPRLSSTELNLQLASTSLTDLYALLSSMENLPRYYDVAQLQLFENNQGAGGTLRLHLYHKL